LSRHQLTVLKPDNDSIFFHSPIVPLNATEQLLEPFSRPMIRNNSEINLDLFRTQN